MASDEQRTGPDAEPPAEGGAEPEGLPAPPRAPRVQYAADQLQGWGKHYGVSAGRSWPRPAR